MTRATSEQTTEAEREPLLREGSMVFLSYIFPPMAAGPAYILHALLSRFDLRNVIVITGNTRTSGVFADEDDVDCRRFICDVPEWWPQSDLVVTLRSFQIPLRLRSLGNVLVAASAALRAASRLFRPETKGIVAVYPKQHFLLAGFLASVVSRKPLIVYFFDAYAEAATRSRRIARILETLVLRRTSLAFAMSAPHREHLEKKAARLNLRRIRVVELPHPFVEVAPAAGEGEELVGRPAIVFTGSIYEAQADSVRRIIEAFRARPLADLEPRLHIFTQSSSNSLRQQGITPTADVSITASTRAGSVHAQRRADLLYLPIGFEANETVRRTAAPSKLPEYLASGRPILVHAPEDAYITRYAREHQFAEIVATPEPLVLAEAVRRLATDRELAARVTQNAARLLERHKVEAVRRLFVDEVRKAVGG